MSRIKNYSEEIGVNLEIYSKKKLKLILLCSINMNVVIAIITGIIGKNNKNLIRKRNG
jgi:hypothetical protein